MKNNKNLKNLSEKNISEKESEKVSGGNFIGNIKNKIKSKVNDIKSVFSPKAPMKHDAISPLPPSTEKSRRELQEEALKKLEDEFIDD